MKVLMINVVCGIRSTGRICTDLAAALEAQGHEVKIAYGREHVPEQFQKYAVRIGNDLDVKLHGVKARLFDAAGFGSKAATKRFIEWVKEYDPDVIHLHNIHGYYINIEVLFDYLKTCGKKIIWTLHDCWAFTGHCTYFTVAKCENWKTHCRNCPQFREYPASLFSDRSKENFERKKELFTGIDDMTLVTPSGWLANLVKQSFLKDYPVEVVYNGIDTNVFKPTESNLREKMGLVNKKVILGVASVWDARKGLNDFFALQKRLNPEEYQIVLIGLSKKQLRALPEGIIGLTRTDSVQQLAQWYSLADVFVNPSLEETFGLTTLEALKCGTMAIVYEDTACEEVAKMYGGVVVPMGDVEKIAGLITAMPTFERISTNVGYQHAVGKYLALY